MWVGHLSQTFVPIAQVQVVCMDHSMLYRMVEHLIGNLNKQGKITDLVEADSMNKAFRRHDQIEIIIRKNTATAIV